MEFKKKELVIYTVCNAAYLNKVMVLAKSVFIHSGIKIDVFVFDKKREVDINSDYCCINWMEDLEISNFKIFSFKYSVIELTTSFKPFLALELLKKSSKVIFLDPDVMVFNSLDSIVKGLDEYPIIITPHYFTPKIDGTIDDERLMRFGTFNLGFFAVNDSSRSKKFLSWWTDRCLSNGYDDTQFGIFTDQKWISIAPNFFPYIHISYHPGLNVAFWNLFERKITINAKGLYIINDEENLIFFHFSSFKMDSINILTDREFNMGNNTYDVITKIALEYSAKLEQYNNIIYNKIYSYDYLSNGKYISPTLRRAYASSIDSFPDNHDPFSCRGVVYEFAKKNHLLQKKNKQYNVAGYKSIEKNSKKFSFIFLIMRYLLKIIGPNKFMNFSRLLVYLSSYHRTPKLWKKIKN